MIKPLIISDTNSKSLKIKKFLIKKIKANPVTRLNLVIVIGGDGFMLKILKKNKKSSNLFYGINSQINITVFVAFVNHIYIAVGWIFKKIFTHSIKHNLFLS